LDAAQVQAERRLAARAYWDIDFTPALEGIDVIEAEREIVQRLTESVGRRLVSDVPLGVFLSGGIDSSSVVALMREHKAARDIRTFSIAFQEKSFDESSYARRVAGLFGTTHKEQRLHPRRLLDILPEVFRTLDEPFADPSFVPTYLLSGFTRRHVTVALGGDGGDELFAGYDPFTADAPGRWLGAFPGGILRMLRSAADLLPVSTKNISFDFKVKKFLEGLPIPERYRHFAWLGSFDPTLHEDLLAPDLFRSVSGLDPFQRIDGYLEQLNGRRGEDSLNAVIYLYCKLYLQDGILVKVDRASMAHSLEVRAPFLDTEFVEYVSRLPASWKLRRTGLSATTKWILKRAMERRLPEDILYRKKKGFGIPIAAWFRGPLREEMQRALSPQRLKRQGIFRPQAVRRYVREHLEGRQNHAKRLWTLLCFQRWWDEHGSGSG
jgi:asparagine synthase (glutamine-hydrolysing)